MNPIYPALLFLIITAAGLYAYFSGYNSANAGVSASAAQDEITQVFSNVERVYAMNSNNFTGLDSTAAAQAGMVPQSWIVQSGTGTSGSTTLQDPWGGAVTLAPANVNGGTANGWSLKLANVPPKICAQIASYYTPYTAGITVNGNSVGDNPTYGTTSTWPPQGAAVATDCNASRNTITWTVGPND